MNILEAASLYAQKAHEGERLKYVIGVYYTHPKAVSKLMHTNEEKIVALLHDVIEHHIKKCKKAHENQGKIFSHRLENKLVREKLEEIETYFRNYGFELDPMILPCLDVLTKRTYHTNYHYYIQCIVKFAEKYKCYIPVKVKRADFFDNSLEDRNPPLALRTQKDTERLARYEQEDDYLQDAFKAMPEAVPRSALHIAAIQQRAANSRRRDDPAARRHTRAQQLRHHYGPHRRGFGDD